MTVIGGIISLNIPKFYGLKIKNDAMGSRTDSLKNGIGKTRHLHAKE